MKKDECERLDQFRLWMREGFDGAPLSLYQAIDEALPLTEHGKAILREVLKEGGWEGAF
jgi:hypothetical protein